MYETIKQYTKVLPQPVYIRYVWYSKNNKKDQDNVSGAGHKICNDGFQLAGILRNDGRKDIGNITVDEFYIDKKNPRVEISFYDKPPKIEWE